ncbi:MULTISPECIES: maleate cis-trans isomerase family protein [unclassified Pseudomonas]|uniref:maleate cis-trans isomerase family protein n=1 Tax=unclassified Pseudomonas TaxID=196821 RepID=UPI0017814C5C|nr:MULTISPECIES: aspartate/glutamate racemase family protein [unclassified Pseudomonas]MBD8601907.1 aspartate/glutamate racemase family protein [Pseudomonas sp. CFBP 8771]MBD8622141.1 aspartate/glutamate racemase family protein [Pseudomonas sp. CFBP 13727]
MTRRIRLGVLTPSSNTALEPLTQALIASLPEVSVHFSRFSVTQIALSADALGQFQRERILDAARLLADAHVDVIGWSGTSAGWLGFDTDVALCQAITEATAIPATTSVLALNKALHRFGIRRLGLVSPYLADVQARIVANYAALGIDASAESHLSLQDNFSFAEVDEATLDRQVAEVVAAGAEAISTFCTNLHAAHRAESWERQHGVPVFDTVTTVLWDMLNMTGVDTRRLTGWGRLLLEEA